MQTISEAVETNDRRTVLIAMRDKIASKIDSTTSARDLAQLSRRLMQILDELETLPDPNGRADPVEHARQGIAALDKELYESQIIGW